VIHRSNPRAAGGWDQRELGAKDRVRHAQQPAPQAATERVGASLRGGDSIGR
jgi:hypothetical protein